MNSASPGAQPVILADWGSFALNTHPFSLSDEGTHSSMRTVIRGSLEPFFVGSFKGSSTGERGGLVWSGREARRREHVWSGGPHNVLKDSADSLEILPRIHALNR